MLVAVVLAGILLAPARAQQGKPAPEDPAHEELRTLRKQLVEAINKNDIDSLLTHLDKDVVVTWMNGEVSRKPAGVREYIERMTKGDNRQVTSYTTEAEADDLTHLYGDTGVVYGHSKDHFVLTDGRNLDVDTRWTASLVKKDGKWLVTAFHASTNMFDNPVLHIAVRRTAIMVGGVAVIVGILVGFLIARLIQKRPAKAA